MKNAPLTPQEIVERGEQIYQEKLRGELEPACNGMIAVINVETGEYELDRQHVAAVDRASARWPESVFFAVRVGYPTLGHIGALQGEGGVTHGFWESAGGEAVVTLMMRGPAGAKARLEAMIDTGFNDEITLPTWAIERLGLPFKDIAFYSIAGGQRSRNRLFRAELEWHGAWRQVMVVEMEGDCLIGMGAMRGSSLRIDVEDGGRVEIVPLPNPAAGNRSAGGLGCWRSAWKTDSAIIRPT